MKQILIAALAPVILAGCVTAPGQAKPARPGEAIPHGVPTGQPPLATGCPNLTSEEIAAIENYKGEFSENALYARVYCVSVEDAERRMAIQLRGAIGPRTEPGPPPLPPAPDASIGALQETLRAQEPGTFAGLWIQHQPSYGVVVAFTSNAAATLSKYTKDPLFIPVDRSGPNLAELRAAQDRLAADFQRLGIRWAGMGSDESSGTVNVDLAQDAAPIRTAAQEGTLQLPDFVRFTEPQPLPHSAPPPAKASDKRVRNFPQLAFRTDMFLSTLVGVPDVPARLVLVDGCFKLLVKGEEPLTALWQASDALDLSDPARVSVIDRLSGTRVFADTDIVLMGLQPGEVAPPKDLVGAAGCPGPYRVVRRFLPRETWDNQRRESAIAARLQEHGTKVAAEQDYAADMRRLEALSAWRDRSLVNRGDHVAAIWIDQDQGTAHLLHTAAGAKADLVPAALQPFVTAQVVPQGARALEASRAALVTSLHAAGVTAQVTAEPLEGYVRLLTTDMAALSRAAVASRVTFPPLVRVEMENQSPVVDQNLASRRQPEAIWYPLEAHPDFAAIRALVEQTPIMRPEPPLPGKKKIAGSRASHHRQDRSNRHIS